MRERQTDREGGKKGRERTIFNVSCYVSRAVYRLKREIEGERLVIKVLLKATLAFVLELPIKMSLSVGLS